MGAVREMDPVREINIAREIHTEREVYAEREVHAEREVYAERDVYAEREVHAVREFYAERTVPPRWPRLVRESAQEWLPEREPTDPEDELFLLGERCAQAYMQADALHYRAMKLLAEFDRRSGWQDTGFGSTAEWLACRIGIQLGSARERLRTALALEVLPLTSEAMRTGEVSFTKVRALTRVATADNEATLLDFARAGSAANLERVVRGWKTLDRKSEVTAEQIRHRSRRFSAFVDDDGMVVVRGRLDPEVGALLMRAVEAASDVLFRDEARAGDEAQSGNQPESQPRNQPETKEEETKPEQRRADAVGLIAERALAAGFGNGAKNGNGNGAGSGTGVGNGKGNGNGARNGDSDGDAPISGTRAERYQVMLHVDAETLKEEGEPGLSELEDGTRVSAETSRRIACDVSVVKIVRGPDGQVVGAGRRTRTVSPSVRRALEARDRGCRFPGCGLRFTEAHHVKHWADGGESDLRNTVLLCRKHHRAVHEGGVRVCLDLKGQVAFFTPKGKALLGAPPTPPNPLADGPEAGRPADPGPTTVGLGRRTPSVGNPLAGAPRWKRDRDIPWEVEARAWEALDSG